MSSSATPPPLKFYKPLYKGRRFWVFQNDPDNPHERWTGGQGVLVYDRLHDSVVAFGNWKDGVNCGGGLEARVVVSQLFRIVH